VSGLVILAASVNASENPALMTAIGMDNETDPWLA